MAINSQTFGRVTLTGEDAAKFDKQVRFGRTNQAAKDSVARGSEIVKVLNQGGSFLISVKAPPKASRKKSRVAKSG